MEIQSGINAFNGAFLNRLQNRPRGEQHSSLRNNSANSSWKVRARLSAVLSPSLTCWILIGNKFLPIQPHEWSDTAVICLQNLSPWGGLRSGLSVTLWKSLIAAARKHFPKTWDTAVMRVDSSHYIFVLFPLQFQDSIICLCPLCLAAEQAVI